MSHGASEAGRRAEDELAVKLDSWGYYGYYETQVVEPYPQQFKDAMRQRCYTEEDLDVVANGVTKIDFYFRPERPLKLELKSQGPINGSVDKKLLYYPYFAQFDPTPYLIVIDGDTLWTNVHRMAAEDFIDRHVLSHRMWVIQMPALQDWLRAWFKNTPQPVNKRYHGPTLFAEDVFAEDGSVYATR